MENTNNAIIRSEDLWKIYRLGQQEVNALSGVSMVVERSEFLAIMGPSGSGKSTLMNLLGCLDTPSRGEYWLNDQLVSSLTENELAHIRNQEIGFVFQNFNLLPRTSALRQVELPLMYAGVGARERRHRAKAALEAVGLGDRLGHRPDELSGGQQQSIAVFSEPALNPRQFLRMQEPQTPPLKKRTAILPSDQIHGKYRGYASDH